MSRKSLFDAVRPFAPGGKLTAAQVPLIDALADALGLAREDDGSAPDPELIAQLMNDEGLELEAYPDPLSPLGQACAARRLPMRRYREVPGWSGLSGGPWTIGYGHTGADVRAGLVWTEGEARAALTRDAAAHNADLELELPWVARLDPVRRRVLQNMAFNLGLGSPTSGKGLLGFRNTLEYVRTGDWARAAQGMLASRWARQVGARAQRLARQMQTGD